MKINHNVTREQKRKLRVRAKVRGTAERPRLSVFRSNKYTALQVIDDVKGTTLVSATEKEIKAEGTKTENAIAVAKLLAEKALKAKITRMVFDRGSYKYHGRVKAVADAVRESGVQV